MSRAWTSCAVLAICLAAAHPADAASEALVYSFNTGTDGYTPEAGLIAVNGKLYGTTFDGGSNGYFGTVYSVTPKGVETVVYSFKGAKDGANPISPLTYAGGTFYGTTYFGGGTGCTGFGCGTVFTLGKGNKEKVAHSFAAIGDGNNPSYAGVIDLGGKYYGTTSFGGAGNKGTVFEYDPATGKEKVLHSFGGNPDGSYPEDSLINVGGQLYGTTFEGGTSNLGTVFRITTGGAEKVIYSFRGGATDGANPYAGLLDVNGVLYGTTYYGAGSGCAGSGCGTVFKLTTSGTENVVHVFGKTGDGSDPYSTLIDVGGTLYGTTAYGGANGLGTVFEVTSKATEKVLHSFAGGTSDGEVPYGALVNLDGTLYGTTQMGGANGIGTVFKLKP